MGCDRSTRWIGRPFVLLLIGAFAWGVFLSDVNVLDRGRVEAIADPLDDVVFALITAAGLYWLARVLGVGRR